MSDQQQRPVAPDRGRFPPPTPHDLLESPVVEGRNVTLSVYAPRASQVSMKGDLAEGGPVTGFVRNAEGVWSKTLENVVPGTYRYQFVIDDAIVPDPRNPLVSPTHTTVMSLVRVTAAETTFEDTQPVPHGAVSQVVYPSATFGGPRRMHVYTPSGYERDTRDYPVLYLLHGGGDCDASWSTIGRAGFILDNLVAAGKALPMLVVMPSGHAPGPRLGIPGSPAMTADPSNDPFSADLLHSVMPHIEATYRVIKTPESRALAGLSMGGVQSLNIGLVHNDLFRYLGIFSSGWFADVRPEFERLHGEDMRAAARSYRLVWTAWGNTDIARLNSLAMLEMFDRAGITYMSAETEGGHTWFNWRHYLAEFAPLLFR